MITRDRLQRSTPIHRPFAAHLPLVPVLVLGVVGFSGACGVPEDAAPETEPPADTASGALRTPVVFNPGHNCTGVTTLIGTAVRRAVEIIRTDTMSLCMQEHNLSATRGYSAEAIMTRMREDTSTQAKCGDVKDPSFGVAGASAPIGGPEVITFDRAYLDGNPDPSELIGVVLHEVAHIKGWEHGTDGHLSGEYDFTVPQQLAKCGSSIDKNANVGDYGLGNVPDGFGLSHGELSRGTVLNPVGGAGGTPIAVGCGQNSFGRGIFGASGGGVDALGLVCSDRNGFNPGFSGTVGGSGGVGFSLDCGDGNVLVGIQGYADGLVNDVAPLCNTAANVFASTGGIWAPGHAGTLTGDFYWRQCPSGMAVKRMDMRAGSRIDGFAIDCERLTMGSLQSAGFLPVAGGATGTRYRVRCPIGTVMTGLTGRSGSAVDRLGARCRQITPVTDPPTGTRWVKMAGSTSNTFATHLEAQGGWGGTPWGTDVCPSTMALVGLDIRSGSRIDRVRGVCADATKWSDERVVVGAVPIQGLGLHGGSGGSDHNVLCPREQFLHGWDINADSRVNRLEPICVRAEN